MGGRAVLILVSFLALGGVAARGWMVAGARAREVRRMAFAQQRAAFLETENTRLSALLSERAAAENLAGEQARRAGIEKEVARLSGHEFLRPVTFREIPRSELSKVLDQKLARQVPDEEFGKVELELAALGLIPPGTDLKKTYLRLLGEQVGAFYDQHTHELFTFSDHPLSNAQNRVIMAHELTHAVQDQRYDLLKLPLEVKGNDDLALACSALVEGDATVLMNNYLAGNLSAAALRDSFAGALTTDVRQLAAAPRYLRESLLFPYLRGQNFVEAITEERGGGAVAAAFGDPPRSTAEIMHPERYLAAERELPAAVDFGNMTLRGKAPAVDNVIGEFTAGQVLELWCRDKDAAAKVASGWRGDRILIYGDRRAYSLLWQVVWQDERAARSFLAAARRGMVSRHGGTPAASDPDERSPDAPAISVAGRSLRVIRDERRVSLIDAQDDSWRDDLTRLAKAAGAQTPP